MEKKRLEIKFTHPNTLNVMVLHAPADRITSILNMGDLGSDIRVHETSNHDLLEFIRASQAELAARGFVNSKAADKPGVMTPALSNHPDNITCPDCKAVYHSGHIDCSCWQSHPDPDDGPCGREAPKTEVVA